MRTAALAFTTSAAALLGGCFDSDFDLDFGDACWFGSPCVSTEHPVAFTQDEHVLALGGSDAVEVLVLDGFQLKLRSTDPGVLAIEETSPGVFAMHGLAEGTATIEATDGTPNPARIFASHTMSVAPIAKVDFTFKPHGDGPLARLASLPGAREAVHVTPLTANDEPVAGGEGLIEFAFTGAQRIATSSTEQRFVVFDLFGSLPTLGFDLGVQFGAIGQGSIVASIGGAPVGTLPIDVIPSADLLELRLSGGGPADGGASVTVGGLVVVNIVGFDAQGTPVAGLIGDWSASPAELLDIERPMRHGEVFVFGAKPGVATLTATVTGRQVSRQITVE